MRVVWTEEAQAHLDGIYQYIARDAPFYAKQTVDKLTHRSEQLITIPARGAPYRNTRIRTCANSLSSRIVWSTA